MADYFTQLSCVLPVGPGNVEAALALYEQMQAELDADGMEIGFLAELHEPGNDSLWLWDGDGTGDVENVIAFVLKCAEVTGCCGAASPWRCSAPR